MTNDFLYFVNATGFVSASEEKSPAVEELLFNPEGAGASTLLEVQAASHGHTAGNVILLRIRKVGTDVAISNDIGDFNNYNSGVHTLVDAPRRAIVVFAHCEDYLTNISATNPVATYGGVTMTKVAQTRQPTGTLANLISVHVLFENDLPANGDNTVTVTWAGTVDNERGFYVAEYSNIDANIEDYEAVSESSPADSTIENSVDVTDDSWVLSMVCSGNPVGGIFSSSDGQVEVWSGVFIPPDGGQISITELRNCTSGTKSLANTYSLTPTRVNRIALALKAFIAGATILDVQSASHIHTAENIVLTQKSTLAAQSSSHIHTAGEPTLTQKSTLAVQSASHVHTSANIDLIQKSTLEVQSASHVHTAANINLIQKSTLAVQSTSHVHAAEAPLLAQKHLLTVNTTSHVHTSENVALVQKYTLVTQSASHIHTAGAPTLIQKSTLAVQSASHGHTAASPTLTQKHLLAVQNASHLHTVGEPILTQKATLSVQEASHVHTAASPTLAQKHLLAVQGATHLHTSEGVVLEVAGGTTLLMVADSSHGHTAQNVDLVQKYTIAAQGSSHFHTVENVILTHKHLLEIQSSYHAHYVESVDLITQITGILLQVQNATHLHTALQIETILFDSWITGSTTLDGAITAIEDSMESTVLEEAFLIGNIDYKALELTSDIMDEITFNI